VVSDDHAGALDVVTPGQSRTPVRLKAAAAGADVVSVTAADALPERVPASGLSASSTAVVTRLDGCSAARTGTRPTASTRPST
jgi:hypothetical protein